MQSVAETRTRLAVVDHHATDKALACGFPELAQAAKVRGGHRGRRLDLHAGQNTSAALHDDVHLRAVLVTVVKERHRVFIPASLSSKLLEYERFEKLA